VKPLLGPWRSELSSASTSSMSRAQIVFVETRFRCVKRLLIVLFPSQLKVIKNSTRDGLTHSSD